MIQQRLPVVTPVNIHAARRILRIRRQVLGHGAVEVGAADDDVRVRRDNAGKEDGIGALVCQGKTAEGEFAALAGGQAREVEEERGSKGGGG